MLLHIYKYQSSTSTGLSHSHTETLKPGWWDTCKSAQLRLHAVACWWINSNLLSPLHHTEPRGASRVTVN